MIAVVKFARRRCRKARRIEERARARGSNKAVSRAYQRWCRAVSAMDDIRFRVSSLLAKLSVGTAARLAAETYAPGMVREVTRGWHQPADAKQFEEFRNAKG